MADYADACRYWFGAFMLATSIGLNLALIADRHDCQEAARQEAHQAIELESETEHSA